MKISVAMITYNCEKYGVKYLYAQLDSIRTQTVPVDEVYIADDCSEDKTAAIIEEYIKKYSLDNWNVYCNKENIGFTGNALNAITKTTGDIVFISDQDDVWLPDKVEEIIKVYEQYDDAAAVSSRFMYIDGKSNSIADPFCENNCSKDTGDCEKLGIECFLGASFIPGCAMSVRGTMRDTILKIGVIDLNKSLGHDWFLHMCAVCTGNEYRLNKPLFLRRFHENNLSMQGFRKKTLMKGNKEGKREFFKETIFAHKHFYGNDIFRQGISRQDAEKTKKTIELWEKRLRFLDGKNPFAGLALLKYIKYYNMIPVNLNGGIKNWVSDVCYTYNIKL